MGGGRKRQIIIQVLSTDAAWSRYDVWMESHSRKVAQRINARRLFVCVEGMLLCVCVKVRVTVGAAEMCKRRSHFRGMT